MKTLCPHCKNELDIPREYIGKQVKCPKCSALFEFLAPEELCENCGHIIGDLDQAYTLNGNVVCSECYARFQRRPEIATTKSPNFVCTACGASFAKDKKFTPGSFFIELILWICFLIPGIIYSIWRLASRKKVCPNCLHDTVIPGNSPAAQDILHHQQVKPKG